MGKRADEELLFCPQASPFWPVKKDIKLGIPIANIQVKILYPVYVKLAGNNIEQPNRLMAGFEVKTVLFMDEKSKLRSYLLPSELVELRNVESWASSVHCLLWSSCTL